MIKDSTRQIIQRTLQCSFDKEQFLNFTKNLLNHINEDKAFHIHGYVKEQFKKTTNIIKTYERLGTYTDPNDKKIDILVVYLEKDNSIDRARTSLRNFVADYLKGRDQKDAALVAFVSPKKDDWRFSLVKMDYKFTEGANGKVKVKEEFTPARRWSFLVGAKESSHTAQSRLAPILEDDINQPTLEQLEDAFNIEKVTKEFFEKYRELFLRLKDNLDEMIKNDAKIKVDFAQKDVDTIDFAKKLLGQIVFLYFLQKKGWFGVERDADWGTGPKDFLRQLFDKKHSDYKNFFNEILEPMFYEALALEREDDYYGSFKCKIPFLNGGLFDPIGSYDWVHTDINLDNELFSNSRPTKQGDIGDGILDIFDRYNFTVREDEPLEKEVAVDPEMLGKVFENLLEVKDRKSKGTYYTPREIVHYMCEQSLVNYLVSETGTNKDTFDHLIRLEQFMAQKLPRDEKVKAIAMWEGEVKKIEKALDDIKIVDPACGSGAFLVGMMQEIVELRKIIKLFFKTNDLTDYEFKSAIIQNNLYGVDIDPGAVEIAKLRLWLSLIVDENDIKQIKPLPNLDYKIMQGNSLLEEFEGIKLFDERIIPQDHADREAQIARANNKVTELQREFFRLHSKNELSKSQEQLIKQQIKDQQKLIQNLQQKPKQGNTVDLFNQIDEIKAKWDELTELHKKIINETNRQEKKKMLDRASELEWQFIEATLKREEKSESLKKIEQFKKKNTKPFFLWHLHFSDVFQSKDGFDVVIANPPYVRISGISESEDQLIRKLFITTFGNYDLYIPFMEKGISLLKQNGNLAYITPNKYLTKRYANKLRPFLLENASLHELIDTSQAKTFDSASVYPVITILSKNRIDQKTKIVILDDKIFQTYFQNPHLVDSYFVNQNDFKTNNDSSFDIFVNTEARKLFDRFNSNTTQLGQYSKILTGTPAIDKFYEWDKLLFSEDKIRSTDKPYRKFLNVSNIKRYHIDWGKEIRAVGKRIKKPYLVFDEKLVGKNKWAVFEKKKIVIKGTALKLTAAYDDVGFANLSLYAVIFNENHNDCKNMLFHLGLLNSKLLNFWYTKKFATSNISGNYISFNGIYLAQLPIKIEETKEKELIINLVDKILHITKSGNYLANLTEQAKVHEYERQIDQMVYKLYDLTPEEIKVVEET